jgi:hypothetical protein
MEIEYLVKTLSLNDVGSTGSHQAGIVIPREPAALKFFPELDVAEINPRTTIRFVTKEAHEALDLNFIYYNGRLHGTSTRNEYRLTGLSRYFKEVGALAGDSLEFTRSEFQFGIGLNRRGAGIKMSVDPDVVMLSGTWMTIRKPRNR